MTNLRTLCVAVAVIILFAAIGAAAPAFDKVTPDGALAFISIRNIPALQKKVENSYLHDIWVEPSVQRFMEKALQRLKEEVQKAEGEAGATLDEVWSLFHGEAAVFVSFDLASGQTKPDVVFLVDVGQAGDRAMKLITALSDAAAKSGANQPVTRLEEDYEGAKLVNVYRAGQGQGTDPDVTYGVAGDVFVVGQPVAAVKRTVTFLKNPPASALAGSASYSAALSKVSASSDFVAFVDVQRIIAVATQFSGGAQGKTAQVLHALGLDGILSASIGVETNESISTSRAYLHMTGPAQGLLGALIPAPGPLHAGNQAPEDAASFFSTRMNLDNLWGEVEKLLTAVAPQALVAMNAQMDAFGQQLGAPFSIRKDIISVYGQRMAFYSRYEKPYNLMTSQQIVMLFDIVSKAAFDTMLGKLQKLIPPLAMMQKQDYMGYDLYVFTPQMPPNAPADAMANIPKPAIAVTDQQMIFSNQDEAAKAYLRRLGKPGASLVDRAEFQQGMQRLPAEGRVAIGFQDPKYQVEMLLTSVKMGMFGPLMGMLQKSPGMVELAGLFDMALLPPAEDITRHLPTTASCVTTGPDGVLMLSSAPTRVAPAGVAR